MANFTFVVLTNPREGQEDDYNRWYNDVHVPDVLRVPGFVAVQRFRLCDALSPDGFDFRYLALYEIETEDIVSTSRALSAAAGSSAMVMSDSLDRSRVLARYFEAITERIEQ